MGKREELKGIPSLVEMPDGSEILFEDWTTPEKERYQERMMDALETELKYCDMRRQKK